MKKFEYYTCFVENNNLEEYLNDKGLEGWELVGMTSPPSYSGSRLVFKREKLVICRAAEVCHKFAGRCHHQKPHKKENLCTLACPLHNGAKCIPLSEAES